MGFSRQDYWSGLPCPPPGDLPDPENDPESPAAPALQAESLPLSNWGSTPEYSWKGLTTNPFHNKREGTILPILFIIKEKELYYSDQIHKEFSDLSESRYETFL